MKNKQATTAMSSENLKWLIGTLLAVASVVIGYLQYRRQVIASTRASESNPEDKIILNKYQGGVTTKIGVASEGQHASGLQSAIAYRVARSIDVSCNSPIFHSGLGKEIDKDSFWTILSEQLNVKIGDCLWLCAEYTSTELLHYVHAKLDFNHALKNVKGFLSLRPAKEAIGITFMKKGIWELSVRKIYKNIHIYRNDERFAKAIWVPDVFKGITINHLNKNERYRLHAIAWVSPKTEQRGRLVLESLDQDEMFHLLAEYPRDL